MNAYSLSAKPRRLSDLAQHKDERIVIDKQRFISNTTLFAAAKSVSAGLTTRWKEIEFLNYM